MHRHGYRNYMYISETKLAQYTDQRLRDPPRKIASETKLKAPFFEQVVKAEFDTSPNAHERIDAVVEDVEHRGLIGDLLDYKPWFRASVPVRSLLQSGRVFFVGQLPGSSVMPVSFAFQCSLEHMVGIENHRAEIERKQGSEGIEHTVDLPGTKLIMPSITSGNHMFAASLSHVSSLVERSEHDLVNAAHSEAGEVPRYFATKADHELHQANRPDEVDLAALAQYWEWNRRISTQFHGAFGGYRAGLVDPPSLSLKQSLRNLLSRSQAKRLLRGETFDRKLRALKKFHNFKVATKRATSDPEGEILDGILSVVGGDTTGWVEVVGLRLLDGYFKREGYRSEGRVILGSPLYLASAYERW